MLPGLAIVCHSFSFAYNMLSLFKNWRTGILSDEDFLFKTVSVVRGEPEFEGRQMASRTFTLLPGSFFLPRSSLSGQSD